MKNILQKPAEDYDPRGRLDPAGFAQHIDFRTYAAPSDLSPFIEHFWVIQWEDLTTTYNSEEVMHRPYVDLFVTQGQSGIQGTFRRKRTYTAFGSGKIIGVRFYPGAFKAFWGGPLANLQDATIDAAKVFPRLDSPYTAQLLAQDDLVAVDQLSGVLRAVHPQIDLNIALINKIIAAVETNSDLHTVSDIAQAFHKSERGLQQLFQDYVGVGLKWLLKRNQLLAAAEEIRQNDQPNWAIIAYDLGYSSQQHFITDFKQIVGKTPLQYKKELTGQAQES